MTKAEHEWDRDPCGSSTCIHCGVNGWCGDRPCVDRTPRIEWCWYTEGGSFFGGFTTRAAAVQAALDDDATRALVGTVLASSDAIVRYLNAKDIAENIDCEMGTDEGITLLPGAQEALEEWSRKYMDHEYPSVCLDGSDITADEIAAWKATR